MSEERTMGAETKPPEESAPRRKPPWLLIGAGIATAGVVAAGIALAGATVLNGQQIAGTPTANPGDVVAVAAERKAAEEAAAKAAEAFKLTSLEGDVKRSMQDYFDDPINGRGVRFSVIEVSLVKIAENKYEGMAKMTADGGPPRDVTIHVTADDRNVMWNTDPGGLMPLFR